MDAKLDFQDVDITKEIYMEQPPTFDKDGSVVCRIKKSLYGLK
jgi:hypothetical protein